MLIFFFNPDFHVNFIVDINSFDTSEIQFNNGNAFLALVLQNLGLICINGAHRLKQLVKEYFSELMPDGILINEIALHFSHKHLSKYYEISQRHAIDRR